MKRKIVCLGDSVTEGCFGDMLAQGEAVGLFVDTPSIPDIFGNPRAAQSPIGPYALGPSPATVVEVR